MPSSFKAQDIFGSGPHRFRVMAQGELLVPNVEMDPQQSGSTVIGPLDFVVEVTGRLVSSTEAGLWTIRDTITNLLTHPPVAGTLVDLLGRPWTDMSFIRFEPGTQTDRGRARSIGYRATFIRLA